ncbi:JAB domain-containing protein [Flavobacteriaceae bacterium M23B6Z8]
MNVRLTEEQKIKILNSEDVYKIMQQVLLRQNKIRRNQEHFWVVGLNHKNVILFIELIAIGRNNRVGVHPPDVFRMAIYKLANRVILVHNHPSGELNISDTDKNLTDKLLKVGKIIEIDVIDHLIISEEKYASFEDLGELEKIKKSGLYEVKEAETEMMRQYKLEREKEIAVKNRESEIALKLHSLGHDLDAIKEITGLTKTELKKILK